MTEPVRCYVLLSTGIEEKDRNFVITSECDIDLAEDMIAAVKSAVLSRGGCVVDSWVRCKSWQRGGEA